MKPNHEVGMKAVLNIAPQAKIAASKDAVWIMQVIHDEPKVLELWEDLKQKGVDNPFWDLNNFKEVPEFWDTAQWYPQISREIWNECLEHLKASGEFDFSFLNEKEKLIAEKVLSKAKKIF